MSRTGKAAGNEAGAFLRLARMSTEGEGTMADVLLSCTNQSCRRPIAFDAQHAGSIQQCPHCGQRVIVPDPAPANAPGALAVQPPAPIAVTPVEERPVPYAYQQERSLEARTSRRLKMGSGCFAMLAVMFAVGLIATGIGTLTEIDEDKLWGLSALVGGIAGLAAFVFFGYVATETASASTDRGRR